MGNMDVSAFNAHIKREKQIDYFYKLGLGVCIERFGIAINFDSRERKKRDTKRTQLNTILNS